MNQNLIANLSIGKVLGKGHFGEVYLGHDQVLGKVAVKILRRTEEEQQKDWQIRKQNLLREGQHLKGAEHDNVVRVYQVLEKENTDVILLVMEECESGSLQSEFEAGPMCISRLRDFLTDVALGLQAVHKRNMIHRDIKPANILIDSRGRAKLGDFGLVTNDILFGYASIAGYIDHLAKEVLEDIHNPLTSIRSDVWAFGMTAYRLLHGQVFYSELPPPKELIQKGNFAQKLPWLPHIPGQWRRFIRQAMHDDPYSRIQDASEILKKLEALPVNPDWKCDYCQDNIVWKRISKDRRIEVLLTKHQNSKKYHWYSTGV